MSQLKIGGRMVIPLGGKNRYRICTSFPGRRWKVLEYPGIKFRLRSRCETHVPMSNSKARGHLSIRSVLSKAPLLTKEGYGVSQGVVLSCPRIARKKPESKKVVEEACLIFPGFRLAPANHGRATDLSHVLCVSASLRESSSAPTGRGKNDPGLLYKLPLASARGTQIKRLPGFSPIFTEASNSNKSQRFG